MENKRPQLGDEVRDSVTGFRGIVVAYCNWLHGCARLTVQPRKLKDGKPIEPITFDELQLELVQENRHVPDTRTGGPRPEPIVNRSSR